IMSVTDHVPSTDTTGVGPVALEPHEMLNGIRRHTISRIPTIHSWPPRSPIHRFFNPAIQDLDKAPTLNGGSSCRPDRSLFPRFKQLPDFITNRNGSGFELESCRGRNRHRPSAA